MATEIWLKFESYMAKIKDAACDGVFDTDEEDVLFAIFADLEKDRERLDKIESMQYVDISSDYCKDIRKHLDEFNPSDDRMMGIVSPARHRSGQ